MDYNIHMNRNNYGFTLIELIVTLAVLGVLFAIAVPDIMFTTTSNRLTSEYNNLRGDLDFARNKSIYGSNGPITISSNSGNNNWSGGYTVTDPVIGVIRVTEPGSTVTITSTVISLTYNPDGTVPAATFTLCDSRVGNFGKQLNVIFSGRASLTNNVNCP